MKIAYLANIQITSNSAQAIQVKAMARAFSQILKSDFLLISSENKPNNNLPKFLRQLIFIIKSLPKAKKFKADYIYTRNIVVAFFSKIFGFGAIYEIHQSFNTKIGDFIFRLIGKNIKIVAISQALKDFIVKEGGAENDFCKDILVAHDGVFLEDFENIKISKKESNFTALYQGGLQEGKGVDLVLEASKILLDINFILLGRDNNKIKKDSLNNILFLNCLPQKEVYRYIKSADLVLLPNTRKLSYWQFTSPLKMFEYMASGVPIIASNLGSIKEILSDKNAIMFDPEKENDLIEKISWARKNYAEAQKRANQAFEDVKNYTWAKRVENILEFLD